MTAWWRDMICWAWGHQAPKEIRGRVRAHDPDALRYLMTHRWECSMCHRQVGDL